MMTQLAIEAHYAMRPQDPQWSRTYNPPADRPFGEPFPGPTQRYPNAAKIREGAVFDQMFTDEMWNLIIIETNRYHDQQAASEPNKHKRKWSPVTKDNAIFHWYRHLYGNCQTSKTHHVLEYGQPRAPGKCKFCDDSN